MRVLIILLAFSMGAFGQFAQRVRFVTTNPSGACGPSFITQNITTGVLTGCGSGTWTALGGGGSTAASSITAGTFGAGDYVFPSDLAITDILTVGATVSINGATGAISTSGPISTGVGGSVAGALDLGQGTLPSLGATAISLLAPTSVISYGLKYPGAAPAANQALLFGAPSSGISTGVFTTMLLGAGNLTTVGAVPYVSATGTLNQDGTVFCWDATNNRLGVGNCAPAFPLDVTGYLSSSSGYIVAGGNSGLFNAGGLAVIDQAIIGWATGSNANLGVVTGLSAISAGLVGVGTGAQGSFAGGIKLTRFQQAATSSDPTCSAAGDLGKRWTDSTDATTTHYKVCANVASTPTWVTVF